MPVEVPVALVVVPVFHSVLVFHWCHNSGHFFSCLGTNDSIVGVFVGGSGQRKDDENLEI